MVLKLRSIHFTCLVITVRSFRKIDLHDHRYHNTEFGLRQLYLCYNFGLWIDSFAGVLKYSVKHVNRIHECCFGKQRM